MEDVKTSNYILTHTTMGDPPQTNKLALYACVDVEARCVFFCAGEHDPRPMVQNGFMAFLSYMQENHAEGRHAGSMADTLESLHECESNAQAVVQLRAEKERLYNQKVQQAIEQNVDNMEKVIMRINTIDAIEDSTDTLKVSSLRFKQKAGEVHDVAWWKLIKARALGVGIAVVLISAICIGVYKAVS